MQIKRKNLRAFLSLLTIASSLYFAVPVSAAGVTLLPSHKYIDVIPGQKAQRVPITIKNDTRQKLTFSVEIADFGALDDSGGPAIYRGNERPTYGLKNFTSLDQKELIVPAGGSEAIVVGILNSDLMKPGGHYGAVLFTLQANDDKDTVKVEQVISSLLFITKKGGDAAKLSIAATTVATSLLSLPNRIDTTIQNSGNVHDVPKGTVTITNPFGTEVYAAALNKERGPVLPETIRKFSYQPPSSFLYIPGVYQLAIKSNAGTYTEKMFILPPVIMVPSLLLLGFGAFMVQKIVRKRIRNTKE